MELNQTEKNTMLRMVQERHLTGLINDGFFENKLPYPSRKTHKKCEHCGSHYKDENAEIKYKNDMAAYRKIDAKNHALFKYAAMWDYGLDGLKPEVYEKTFALAWDRGHSAGLHEVYNCLADLADLMILTIEKD